MIPFEKLVLDQETYEINRSYTAIKRSIYVRHLQRWLQYFPPSQIHIVDGDNMISRPWEELSKVGAGSIFCPVHLHCTWSEAWC